MSFGIAVPCHKPYYGFIPMLLRSICEQTIRPNHIVISCSSWVQDMRQDFTMNGINVTILFWERIIFQAENRNIAARELNTDYIGFFDVDDIMHPHRVEYILRAFKDSNCDAVCHNFQTVRSNHYITPFPNNIEYSLFDRPIVKSPYTYGVIVEGDLEDKHPLHHAHVTLRKEVFDKFQYNEDASHYRIEDSTFLGTLANNNISIRYLDSILSQYICM